MKVVLANINESELAHPENNNLHAIVKNPDQRSGGVPIERLHGLGNSREKLVPRITISWTDIRDS